MENIKLVIKDRIAILEFDQPDSKVNVLNTRTMEEVSGVIDQLGEKSRSELDALLITSSKDGIFIAGADIKEIEGITATEEAEKKAEQGKEIMERLEKINLITVAVINGACLGGGFELALSCKYRVAGFGDKVKIGLPEVNLGIIPGFGGTQRLPKLIGLTAALPMILAGQIIGGKKALRSGVVNKLFPDVTLAEDSIAFVKDILEGKVKEKKKKKKLSRIFLENTLPGRALVFNQARKGVIKKTKGHYAAPLKAIDLIKRTYGRSLKYGSILESKLFSELAVTDESKNLIKIFYLFEEFKKLKWVDKDIHPDPVNKCGILGAGVMGGGIAQLVSFNDVPVRIKDISHEALGTALKTAKELFDYALKKRKLKQHDVDNKFGLISPTLTYDGFKNADMIIEAVVEDMDIKKKVFNELGKIVSEKTMIVSNTSALLVTEMGEASGVPERVAGMHFFNPVHRMPLVEVIRSEKTNEHTLASVIAFARKLGKVVIVVKDVPGFLVNRILLPYLNEAGFIMEEGVTMERIDKIACAFGMPMGPVTLMDEVGIDVGYKVVKILEEAYGDRMKVCSLLEKAKTAGLLGRKAKLGFYIHKGRKRTPNPAIYDLVDRSGKPDISDDTILKRLIYVMINEAARCIEEGVVARSETIDVGMIAGTGFPPFRAGLMRYADEIGCTDIVGTLKDLQEEFSHSRFEPCGLLKEKAKKNEKFYV